MHRAYYDAEYDTLYYTERIPGDGYNKSEEVEDGIFLDIDNEGNAYGFMIHNYVYKMIYAGGFKTENKLVREMHYRYLKLTHNESEVLASTMNLLFKKDGE